MIPLAKLRAAARDALAYASAQPGVAEAEVFASANGNLTVRLNYTSHIPSNGVEEPKSLESHGLGLRVAFNSPEGLKIGFGSEPTDLSLEGVRRALEKARLGAVLDPDFVSLPKGPSGSHSVNRGKGHSDPAIMRMGATGMVRTGWSMMNRALDVFQGAKSSSNSWPAQS